MAKKQLGVAPSNATDAATKGYVDVTAGSTSATNDSLARRDSSGRITASDGTLSTHLVTKGQLDVAVPEWKDAVRVASTANITLTAPGTTIDGVTMSTGDRFLAKNQTTPAENGIYVFATSATAATRALDMDSGEKFANAHIYVVSGTANAVTYWKITNTSFVNVGSTSVTVTKAADSANTASVLVQRDSASRFQAADPSAAQDVATKNYVDAIVRIDSTKTQVSLPSAFLTGVTVTDTGASGWPNNDVTVTTTKASTTEVEQRYSLSDGTTYIRTAASASTWNTWVVQLKSDDAIDSNTPGKIVQRDGSGNASISTPTTGSHIANKTYVDGQISTYGTMVRTTRIYTAGATWSKPLNLVYAVVRVQGGGGGGAGRTAGASTWSVGGGGGAGGYCEATILAATLGSTETVTVGAFGAGGVSANGSAGTSSSFGGHLVAGGGSGGLTVNTANTVLAQGDGGAGGTLSGTVSARLDIVGQAGGPGRIPYSASTTTNSYQYGIPGAGGDAVFGSGAGAANIGQTGATFTAVGYGGGGGGILGANATGNGGDGAPGIVIVEEYTSAAPLALTLTSAPTASTAMSRDGSGRSQVVDPSAAQDIATKNYVDNVGGTSHTYTAIATPSAPSAGALKQFGKSIGGRPMPAFIGPVGEDSVLQPHIGGKSIAWVTPVANTTSPTVVGMGLSTTGTATAGSISTTNLFQSMKRIEYLTAASTTSVAGIYATNTWLWRGNAARLGGFHVRITAGPATAVTLSTDRFFMGLLSSTSAPTDVQPSSLLNMVGIGWDAADSTVQLFTNDGSGTATKTSLATLTKASADRTGVYQLDLYASANGSTIGYTATDVTNNVSTSGTISTDLPANTSFLAPRAYYSVGGTSGGAGIALFNLYAESDN